VRWPLPLSLAMILAARGQSLDRAEAIASQALAISLATNEAYGAAACQLTLGWIASLQGGDSKAMERFEDGLAHARTVGDLVLRRSIMATMLSNLADECRMTGRLREARSHLEEAAALYATDETPSAEF